VLDIRGKVIGVGQLCVLLSSGSLIRGSHVCIVSVFLDIPAKTVFSVKVYHHLSCFQFWVLVH
jgi:hypothetical protein